jgi:hypothetical protein
MNRSIDVSETYQQIGNLSRLMAVKLSRFLLDEQKGASDVCKLSGQQTGR